jgi:hypothetical protein
MTSNWRPDSQSESLDSLDVHIQYLPYFTKSTFMNVYLFTIFHINQPMLTNVYSLSFILKNQLL